LVLIGDREMFAARAAALRLPFSIPEYQPDTEQPISLRSAPLAHEVVPGRLDPRNARAVIDAVGIAVDGCMSGEFSAMVTAPLHKGVINDAGIEFTGHTEFIADRTGGDAVMMLIAGDLRVALATTHLPLSKVPAAITGELIERVLRALVQDLRTRFELTRPRILVLGLNPHAGEGGHIGTEELEVIEPCVASLCAEGMALTGPVAADTAFIPAMLTTHDAVLAMYHDQGLPVLKYAGFGSAVNMTLGLPIIRTSVDHGTALPLAGTGTADSGSLRAAVDLARQIAVRGTGA
jgi:4-hydroxythreonine-4-phosphate dehydrogenase